MQQTPNIIGWGADAALENRPGVPEELPPQPIGYASLGGPSAQTIGKPTAKSFDRPLTATYGTTIPLRGLSGVIRRAAYQIPTYKPRRWMLLLLADRIDVDVEWWDSDVIDVLVEAPGIPGGDTLVTRAVRALLDLVEVSARVWITIEKEIPIGAGLGGGSSDAAAALGQLLSIAAGL